MVDGVLQFGCTPVHYAAAYNFPECLSMLLRDSRISPRRVICPCVCMHIWGALS